MGQSKKGWLARLLPFLGPAFIASIAYVDPGNFATNIQGGAQFGYELLWVILASNLMAMLLQALSAKLGIATGKNLAEHCREHFPRWVVWTMWALMEVVAMATDLAEFLGAAVALNLLFGLPLWLAGILTAVITFLILGLNGMASAPLKPSSRVSWRSSRSHMSSNFSLAMRTGLSSPTIPLSRILPTRKASFWRRVFSAPRSCHMPSTCTPH